MGCIISKVTSPIINQIIIRLSFNCYSSNQKAIDLHQPPIIYTARTTSLKVCFTISGVPLMRIYFATVEPLRPNSRPTAAERLCQAVKQFIFSTLSGTVFPAIGLCFLVSPFTPPSFPHAAAPGPSAPRCARRAGSGRRKCQRPCRRGCARQQRSPP